MKYFKIPLLVLVIMVFAASCQKDPELESSEFTIAVYPKIGAQNMLLGQEYLDQENYRIEPTMLRFYVSHVTLTSTDGDVEVIDLALMDMDKVEAGQPMLFTASAPAGSYTGIKFWIGLDSTQNSSDPSDFEPADPLSAYQGTFWTWNTGYRFVMFEGLFDTVPNTPGPVSSTQTFGYHTGTAPLYSEAVLGGASTPFSIPEGANYTYNLDLDINKVFYGDQSMDRKQGAVTHTTSNFALAEKFTENFVRAFSLSAP